MRDAGGLERGQERLRIAIRAHEDRDVAVGAAAGGDERADPLAHVVGLGGEDVEAVLLDSARGRRHRAQALVDLLLHLEPIGIVVLDQAVGRIEDGLSGAIRAGEDDARALRIGRCEPEDVADRGPAELVDRLAVVVRPRSGSAGLSGQELQELELDHVRVLELVDQDVAEAAAHLGEDVLLLAEEAEREEELIAEVDAVGRAQLLSITR